MGNNSFSKLKRFYKYNIAKIFLIGILCGSIFMAIHVVTRAVDSQHFSMMYTAHIYVSYTMMDNSSDISVNDCWDVVKNSRYTEEIKAYLGSYVDYDDFLNNLRFEISDGKITVYYTDDSQVRAKRIVNNVSSKLCSYFSSENRVGYISKNGKTIAEEIKVVQEPRIKIGVTYFTEIGIVLGWIIGIIIWFIIYFGNGRIKSKSDVEEELHITVLTEIPHIDELV